MIERWDQPEFQSWAGPVGLWWHVVLWCVLGLAVLAIALRVFLGGLDPETEQVPVEDQISFELRVQGRYLVGLRQMLQHDPDLASVLSSEVISQLEIVATTPADELRAIPLYAEAVDVQTALSKLDALIFSGALDEQLLLDARILERIYQEDEVVLTSQERQRLLNRHGWFGKLAVSFNLSALNEVRRGAIMPAMRTLVIILIFALMGIACSLAGLVLFIAAVVLACMGKVGWSFAEHSVHERGRRVIYLEAFVLYMLAMMVFGLTTQILDQLVGLDLGWALLMPVILVPLWPLLRGVNWRQWCGDMGWHRGRGFWREVGAGVVGYVAGLPLLGLGLVLTVLLISFIDALESAGVIMLDVTPSHPIINEILVADSWEILLIFVVAVIWAPLVEEIMFRGAFYHYLRGALGMFFSASIVGLIFAAVHPQGFVAIPVLGAIAVVLALIREWRGSIIGSMTAHGLNNLIMLSLLTALID